MITLYQFPRVWGLPNASPFCMKLETFLRMTEIEYGIKWINNPAKAPKGKLPFVKMEDKIMGDSELIIDHLLHAHPHLKLINEEQQARARFIDICLSERLYWIILYSRWKNDEAWAMVKKAFFGHLPPLAKWFVPKLVRKYMLKSLYYQGMGRHSYEEITEFGKKTIDGLVEILDGKKYLFGEKPSWVDASLFGFMANIIWSPLDDPIKKHALSYDVLKEYCIRMWQKYFPEMKLPS
ncbi:glutathione S-transferase C-terminal domain-containing protein [Legionella israelensis]|uniref:Glutathione S-transferase family protein n=1 Tax=Legionella israelensis TaxID=454 RepID=A0A0W0VHN5_9GAMM|nr:glutathione S-transferase C-terminal domain-containing protein [Legionella israelensis]KTD19644.1 hypothetical protein Lisr_1930 [Legionella israelensis]QBS09094.1 glutathione S-transferase family protein [Legionella israelensis]SCY09047.1 Glutathione S-transferase [Legionella israelensis DSM 19235]STX58814.1 Uncharacterised protein [Legionella israelensis]